MYDQNLEKQINDFQAANPSINLVSLTKEIEKHNFPAVWALNSLPEKAQDQAFPLVAAINAEDRKIDPSLPTLKPFSEVFSAQTDIPVWKYVARPLEKLSDDKTLEQAPKNAGLDFQDGKTKGSFLEQWDQKTGQHLWTSLKSDLYE